jgi:chromosome segregation ATPase
MRILRCLSHISTVRFFKKRLATVESDRKAAHAQLWSNRLNYESSELAMEKELAATHRKLADREMEIEKLKQQLHNEKDNNIQLVHWKAKHLKQIENLKKEIDEFLGVGDVNITKLLAKLSDTHQELDELKEENEKFDVRTEEEVRKPMRNVDKMRGKIYTVKRAKSSLLEVLLGTEGDVAETEESTIVKLNAENAKLRKQNQLLLEQIWAMEATKDAKAADVRHYMEATIQPPLPSIRGAVKAPGIIIRPLVLNKCLAKA